MSDTTIPSEGDLVRITFERENGIGEPMVQGSVVDVDADPTGPNELVVDIDEAGDNNQTIQYFEGYTPDESFERAVCRTTPYSSGVCIGTSAELQIL